MNVINAVAQFEQDLLIERTQAGLARAKAQGIPPRAATGAVSRSTTPRAPENRKRITDLGHRPPFQHQPTNHHAGQRLSMILWDAAFLCCDRPKTGKGYACTLDKGEKLEGRFCLFPKDKTNDQPPEDEEAIFIKNYQSAGDEYGI